MVDQAAGSHRPISVSAWQTFQQCPWKLYASENNLPTGGKGDSAILGAALHDFIARYGRLCLAEGVDRSGEHCERAQREALADTDRAAVGDEYQGLSDLFYETFRWPVEADSWGIETQIGLGANGAIVDYNSPEAIARMKIDFWYVRGSTLTVIDWKSGRTRIDVWDGKRERWKLLVDKHRWPKDEQLRWYLEGMFHRIKGDAEVAEIQLCHWYLRPPTEPIRTHNADMTVPMKSLRAPSNQGEIFREIVLAHSTVSVARERGYWPCKSSKLCDFCEYGPKEGSGVCPFFKDQQAAVDKLVAKQAAKTKAQAPAVEPEAAAPEPKPEPEPESRHEEVFAMSESPAKSSEKAPPPPATVTPEPTPDPETEPVPRVESSAIQREAFGTNIQAPPGWEVASRAASKLKIMLFGAEGTFKTRALLTLFAKTAGPGGRPRCAVIDTEDGAGQYGDEFHFFRVKTHDSVLIEERIANPPEGIASIVIDSFTVYRDSVYTYWNTLFKRRESTSSPGHKRDYYTLQPRDYEHPRRQIGNLIRTIIDLPIHVGITAQAKPEYDDTAGAGMMKKIGEQADVERKAAYYMDTVVHLVKRDDKVFAITLKDRTHHLPDRSAGEWEFTPEIFAGLMSGEINRNSVDTDPSRAPASDAPEEIPEWVLAGGTCPDSSVERSEPIDDAQKTILAWWKKRASAKEFQPIRDKHLPGDKKASQLTRAEAAAFIRDLNDLVPF